MKSRFVLICVYVAVVYGFLFATPSMAHDIIFCGERIPVDNNFVAQKLMNIIRKQIPNVNFPQLNRRAKENFPVVEYYLRETGLPLDFKYLAIVESGFENITSNKGAQGFWQLMPETAVDMGLSISPDKDERNNIYKSTYAACKVLADYYIQIRKKYGISSWVLTAAAYNFGIGNIFKAISKQGQDYFSMNLNAETATYVYKIIAVKELFEYPELYMKDFGYNVFTTVAIQSTLADTHTDTSIFGSMTVNVKEDDGKHPQNVTVKTIDQQTDITSNIQQTISPAKVKYVSAYIKGKYKDFKDGETISIELFEDLEIKGSFNKKGNILLGKGWIIDDRIFIDLGYNDHDVIVTDFDNKKGIKPTSLKNKQPILIKVQEVES